jgi:hypothetical protein
MTVFSPLLSVVLSVGTPAVPTAESVAEARSIVEDAMAALLERLQEAGFLYSVQEVEPG